MSDHSESSHTHSIRRPTDHVAPWPLTVGGPELGADSGSSNEFMAILSHELRNSLSAVRGATRILRMERSGNLAVVKAREVVEHQVELMVRLVEDLLDVSRSRSGHLQLRCERVDLRSVVADAARAVEFTMQRRGLRMTASVPDAPMWLRADPIRLEQVFVNLLINAAKYTDVGGYIGLSVGDEPDGAIVCISDTGIGIAPDILPHVFDLFFQADPLSRGGRGGLGIGLALVRDLVELHGGSVLATSAGVGQGSEFVVRLPKDGEN